MFRNSLLSVVFAAMFAFSTAGQSPDVAEPFKIDEFGRLSTCDFSARIDAIYFAIGNNEHSRSVVFIYRGAKATPAEQDEATFKSMKDRIEMQIKRRKYDPSLVEIVDGGFRDTNGMFIEVFLIRENARKPSPTETVSAPVISLKETLLAQNGRLSFEDALLEKLVPEIEYEPQEDPDISEPDIEAEENPESVDTEPSLTEEFESEDEIYEFFEPSEAESDEFQRAKYWENLLKADSAARGVIVFYADDQKYDVGMAKSIIEEWLKRIAPNSGLDLKRIEVVYGGYRTVDRTEFWFVPKGGRNVVPTPEPRPIPEPANSETPDNQR